MKGKYKQMIKVLLGSALFSLICCVCSAAIHAVDSAFIQGVHGKPSFVNDWIFIYSFYEKFSFAIAYAWIGGFIPIRNKVVRGFVYLMLVWASNFVPQFMGLAFADGPIAHEVFSISILVCDSLVFLIGGLILGVLVPTRQQEVKRCTKGALLKSTIISTICFPLIVIISDTILTYINSDFGSRGAMMVSEAQAAPFYTCFYGCFLVTGALLPLFYRLTTYNQVNGNRTLKFGLIYALLIWTPVVLIMALFGTALVPTIIYALVFIAVIVAISIMNGALLDHFNKKGEDHESI